ncbi:MAG: ankyrin repeat domain-containing protein [Wenzhouxiangella sp.]|nr:MAG: ankyrin repeat domain-containing protein [Wenzhouxiangella sp.]
MPPISVSGMKATAGAGCRTGCSTTAARRSSCSNSSDTRPAPTLPAPGKAREALVDCLPVMRLPLLAAILLLSSLASVHARSAGWEEAIRANQLDTIRSAYRDREDVDEGTEHGKTALMAAAAAGDAGLVDELLAAGADPGATNRLGGTVLMYAIGGGDLDTVRRLLDTGIAVDGQASNGWGAVTMAAAKNEGEMLALLGAAGADPNPADIYGWTPLMRAAYEGHRDSVMALLELPGLDLGRVNNSGQTALHLAVISGSAELVQALLDHGARQTADSNDYTPQSIARELNRDDLLLLLTHADPDL